MYANVYTINCFFSSFMNILRNIFFFCCLTFMNIEHELVLITFMNSNCMFIFLQILRMRNFFPWTLKTCLFKWSARVNELPHVWHLCFLTPSWTTFSDFCPIPWIFMLCLFRWSFLVNDFPHSSQSKFLRFSWTLFVSLDFFGWGLMLGH